MIRSLRLRVFLTVWPLTVLALAAVGLQFGRWMGDEFERFEGAPSLDGWAPHRARWASQLGAQWDAAALLLLRIGAEARRTDPSATLLVLDTLGGRRAATPGEIPLDDFRWRGNGVLEVTGQVRGAGTMQVTTLRLHGTPVASPSGRRLGYLYVLSTPPEAGGPSTVFPLRTLAADAWRMIWTTVGLASVLAAAITLLLAGPIVAQVRRLAAASARIRAGALDSRVAVTSRDELGELERAFNDMATSLDRSEATKRNMISDVSHELRTPLTNVLGLLEAMRDGLRAPDAATLELARQEAALLATLIDELQELNTAESGALRFDLEPLDATAEARSAAVACRVLDGPHIEPPPASMAPIPVLADRRRLAQVLRNLLRNAIVHTRPAGVVRVEVTLVERGRVAISVIDTGEGIPVEHLPLIWERFHRVDPSRSRQTGGMGLGLAVVRQLVRGMGGDMSVESTAGCGSRFTVVLPSAPCIIV